MPRPLALRRVGINDSGATAQNMNHEKMERNREVGLGFRVPKRLKVYEYCRDLETREISSKGGRVRTSPPSPLEIDKNGLFMG